MTCLIVGDSIAVGLAGVVKGCYVAAWVGATSSQILAWMPVGVQVNFAYISSGTNDAWNSFTLATNLAATRANITAKKVVWIVPVDPTVAEIVRQAGLSTDDRHVAFVPGPDNIHPRNYWEVGMDTLEDNRH
jgi:hypothetical protein